MSTSEINEHSGLEIETNHHKQLFKLNSSWIKCSKAVNTTGGGACRWIHDLHFDNFSDKLRLIQYFNGYCVKHFVQDLRGDPKIVKDLEWIGKKWVDDRFWGWQCVAISGSAFDRLSQHDTDGVQILTNKTEIHQMSEKLGNYLDKETEEDCAHHCDFDSIDCDFISLSYRNDSGKIIGYCLGFESFVGPEMTQRIWWLEDLFVEEYERGKGIGRKLLSKMAKKGFLVFMFHTLRCVKSKKNEIHKRFAMSKVYILLV